MQWDKWLLDRQPCSMKILLSHLLCEIFVDYDHKGWVALSCFIKLVWFLLFCQSSWTLFFHVITKYPSTREERTLSAVSVRGHGREGLAEHSSRYQDGRKQTKSKGMLTCELLDVVPTIFRRVVLPTCSWYHLRDKSEIWFLNVGRPSFNQVDNKVPTTDTISILNRFMLPSNSEAVCLMTAFSL